MKRKIRGNTTSRQYTDRYTLSSSKWQNDYNVLYRSASVDDDEFGSLEVFNGFAGQVSIIAPYDDADYFWATFENGTVKLIQGTKVKDKMYYMTPDDWDMTNSEWCQEVVNMIVDALDEKNRKIKSKMIHMSTDIDTYVEDDEGLPQAEQEYDSAKTSINSKKLPAIYNMISLPKGSVGVDYGGGKFDNAIEALAENDVTLYVYDPYNRSSDYNKETLRALRANGGADFAINSNVLNVIKEPEARLNVLENIKRITKPGAPIYITVYEGSGKGNEGATKSGYQLNRRTADYLEEIQEVFPDAKRKGKLIVATNSGTVNSSTTIQGSSELYSADELRQQIKYKLHKILKTQLGFDDHEVESYSRVDAYFVDNRLVIEVGCEVEYETLEEICNQLNPIVQECDPDSYFEPEQPGIITAFLNIENCEDAIESCTKVVGGSQESWIDKYFDRVDTMFMCRNAGYELEDLLSADDIDEYDGDHVAWLVPKPDYADVLDDIGIIELIDEDGQLFIGQTAINNVYDITSRVKEVIDSIESSTKVVGGLYDIPERPLDPPEDDEYEEETDNTTVYIDFDTTITVGEDGDYDYDEGYSFADCPDNKRGTWYSATYNVYLGDGADMVEYIDDLIITQVPAEPGKYHIKGEAQLYFEVDNIQVSRDYFWDERHGGDYDEEAYTDNAEVYFNKAGSSLEKFKIEKI